MSGRRAAPSPAERLRARAAAELPEASEAPSRFGGALAFRRGRREFAHFHGEEELDLRLPPAEQRALRDDPRAVTRPARSPWIAYRLEDDAGALERAFDLLRRAYAAAE